MVSSLARSVDPVLSALTGIYATVTQPCGAGILPQCGGIGSHVPIVHCVSAAGFGGGGLGPEEENGLSPETCYGCKTNRHQKKSVWRGQTSNLTLEGVSLASVDVDQPLKLLLNRSQLKPSEAILELLPAVRALAQHVMYTITAGNHDGFFQIRQRAGISYLHSTHRTPSMRRYRLQIRSSALSKEMDRDERLAPNLHMTLHITLQ
ncbi:fibrillin-1-like [Sinocyclocheilus grahami]|uniref:fibrillin-1-like n=1 Tax=Sinocyclocheilus grahami TaxID=75366 RepID=UPI0007AD39A3|nr:PREDICTED: fibrillin-1-like [Sinocyclocheilus grahami]